MIHCPARRVKERTMEHQREGLELIFSQKAGLVHLYWNHLAFIQSHVKGQTVLQMWRQLAGHRKQDRGSRLEGLVEEAEVG